MSEKKDICPVVSKFILDVKQRKISGSYNIAVSTVEVIKQIITQTEWKTAEELLKLIKDESKHLRLNLRLHTTVVNIVRRILKIIREEHMSCLQLETPCVRQPQGIAQGGPAAVPPLSQILREDSKLNSIFKAKFPDSSPVSYSLPVPDLKEAILDHIRELETELENSPDNIPQQACEHIHPNEIILTIGKSSSVEAFLKVAASKRKFHVIVTEGAPFCLGHEMAVQLGRSKIETTVIADSAVFALMPRVNKVIIGTHTVLRDGSLLAICGSHGVALAAKYFQVPVYVLAPTYKLSTIRGDPDELDEFNCSASPEGVLHYSDGAILSKVQVCNPLFDYVPWYLVTLLISNSGGYSIHYMPRLLKELYDEADKNV